MNLQIHIHCFTDSPEFAQRLLNWFPNLYIGITGAPVFTVPKTKILTLLRRDNLLL